MDSELLELRQTIELLRKQSVEAGLTSAHIQSMSPSLARRHTININTGVQGKENWVFDVRSSLVRDD